MKRAIEWLKGRRRFKKRDDGGPVVFVWMKIKREVLRIVSKAKGAK